jgi:hypothetical protein
MQTLVMLAIVLKFQKSESSVLLLILEKLGLELDNRGSTTKHDHRRIYCLCHIYGHVIFRDIVYVILYLYSLLSI